MKFTVHGPPKGKQRPRARSLPGGRVQIYTPSETHEYEALVALEYRKAGGKKYEGPVALNIKASFRPPKKTSKKKLQELFGEVFQKKPDADNIAKIIMDALNGVAYDDDNQVALLIVSKTYSDLDAVEVSINKIKKGEENK